MAFVYLFLILMIIIWSFSFIIVDVAVESIPPLSLALYRFIIASASFLILDFYFKISKKKNLKENAELDIISKFSVNQWILVILASFTGASVFFVAQYSAIQLIGPSLPALFVCLLAPVIIAVFSLLFFDEKLSSLKIIGFAIATIGGFLLITGGDIKTLTPESPHFLGYVFALITPLLWAIYTIAIKKISKSKQNSEIQILKYVAYLGTIELLIFVMLNNEFWIFLENFLNIIIFLCALYLGVGCYVLGYYIWQRSQNYLKSSKVASFLYIEPFITLLFSYLFQRSETVVLWNILGGIIVLVAVLIINYN
ncbi:MAG: DMT family transporter [Candidatus Hodarchaeota archaeon]